MKYAFIYTYSGALFQRPVMSGWQAAEVVTWGKHIFTSHHLTVQVFETTEATQGRVNYSVAVCCAKIMWLPALNLRSNTCLAFQPEEKARRVDSKCVGLSN